MAILELAAVVYAETRILENDDMHVIKEDAITKIEETDKLRDLFRYIS